MMSLDFPYRKDRTSRNSTMRGFSGWILCALLVILCVDARLARYDIHHRTLKLATTHVYLAGAESLRKLPKTAPLVWWQALTIAGFVASTLHAVWVTNVLPKSVSFQGFDPENYSRPPPIG